MTGASADAVELYTIKGVRITTLNTTALRAGNHRFNLGRIAGGMYLVKVGNANASGMVGSIIVK